MTKEQLQHRVALLEGAVQQSLANHNALLGQLSEAKHWLSESSSNKESSSSETVSEVKEDEQVAA